MLRPMPMALTQAQARAHDAFCMRTLGIPGVVLMENAARGCAEMALRMLPRSGPRRVTVMCGPGQNGGDGHAIARHLHVDGCRVEIVELAPPPAGTDAATMRAIVVAMGLPPRPFQEDHAPSPCDLLVDALFGIGLDRPLEGRALEAVRAVNGMGRPVLSVDLPSGMHCDSGRPMPECVQATATATMAALKVGFTAPGAAAWIGRVEVVQIGGPAPSFDR